MVASVPQRTISREPDTLPGDTLAGVDGGVTRKLGRGQVRCEDDDALDALQLEGALDRKADGSELRIGVCETCLRQSGVSTRSAHAAAPIHKWTGTASWPALNKT